MFFWNLDSDDLNISSSFGIIVMPLSGTGYLDTLGLSPFCVGQCQGDAFFTIVLVFSVSLILNGISTGS